MTLRVFVTVGTDHHPFDRLIGWMDEWAGSGDVELVVQHGSSSPSRVGRNEAMMPRERLMHEYALADIVVAQVGPGTIADANQAGLRPIVVPRDPRLGEVVDDHQFAFGEFMATKNRVELVTEQQALVHALDRFAADTKVRAFQPEQSSSDASTRVAALASSLIQAPRQHTTMRRIVSAIRPGKVSA